jgi:hypothetical protein
MRRNSFGDDFVVHGFTPTVEARHREAHRVLGSNVAFWARGPAARAPTDGPHTCEGTKRRPGAIRASRDAWRCGILGRPAGQRSVPCHAGMPTRASWRWSGFPAGGGGGGGGAPTIVGQCVWLTPFPVPPPQGGRERQRRDRFPIPSTELRARLRNITRRRALTSAALSPHLFPC